MPLSIDEFVTDFRAAIAATSSDATDTKTVRLALRSAKNLRRILATLSEGGSPVAAELSMASRLKDQLEEMLKSTQLGPMIRKAEALVALDDFVEPDKLSEIQDLLKQAKAIKGSGRAASTGSPRFGPLPFLVAADCEECDERLVGMRGGVNRWRRVEKALAAHESEVHRGVIDPAKEFANALSKLQEGQAQTKVGRYRFSRLEN